MSGLRTFHFYHRETGEFHSKKFCCDSGNPYGERDAAANAPDGHAHIEAHIVEPWKHRVDVSTGKLVSLTP